MNSPHFELYKHLDVQIKEAEYKHPVWPNDIVYGAAIMVEEAGEAMRAAVQFEMESGDLDDLKLELMHIAATCIRMLKNLPDQHECSWCDRPATRWSKGDQGWVCDAHNK